MKNYTTSVNAGYKIINKIDVKDRGIALGESQEREGMYVTWECSNGNNYYWGHYYNNRDDAERDFYKRALGLLNYYSPAPVVEDSDEQKNSETIITRVINGEPYIFHLTQEEIQYISDEQHKNDMKELIAAQLTKDDGSENMYETASSIYNEIIDKAANRLVGEYSREYIRERFLDDEYYSEDKKTFMNTLMKLSRV